MNENLLTVGLVLLFFGGMLGISGSTFVTEGGVKDETYTLIGVIELLATLIALLGIVLVVKNA